ncbi:MAG TPA: PA14 domain-containing protein [Tepidisphaeraceae bacterium]|nr:PA14 domain-containing protein [Tepidisphaeraceae bacterium]
MLSDAYKSGSLDKRRESARELLRQGIATRDDSAARYVLLNDAADMASAAGDGVTVAHAIDELAASFQLDPIDMKIAKLGEAAKNAFTRDAIDGLVACCMLAESSAVIDERYDPAERLAAIADGAADRAKRIDLKATVTERKKELDALRAGAGDYLHARDLLTKTPGDPAASLTAGRFLCLVKGDWDRGLPILAAGSDEALHGLAVKDLENPSDAGQRAQVGGGWWDLASKLTGVMKTQARRRALYWYRLSITGLAGVSRTAVESRLREVQAERLHDLYLSPGLLTEMYEGLKFEKKRVTRIDSQIDFTWKDKPAERMPADNFSVIWTGLLNIAQSGQYTFVIIANNGAAIDLDGAPVFNEDDMARKRNGERITLKLEEGIHPFRLKFWDTTGLAKIRLLWITPGSTTSEVVPVDAFCRDPATASFSQP